MGSFLFTDKCGDVYISKLDSDASVTEFTRIMGHCGLILDAVRLNLSVFAGCEL